MARSHARIGWSIPIGGVHSQAPRNPRFVWLRPATLACSSGGVRLRVISRAMSGDSRLVSVTSAAMAMFPPASGNLVIAKPTDRNTAPLTSPGRIISGVNKRSSTKGRIDRHVSSTLAYVQKERRYMLGSRRGGHGRNRVRLFSTVFDLWN